MCVMIGDWRQNIALTVKKLTRTGQQQRTNRENDDKRLDLIAQQETTGSGAQIKQSQVETDWGDNYSYKGRGEVILEQLSK